MNSLAVSFQLPQFIKSRVSKSLQNWSPAMLLKVHTASLEAFLQSSARPATDGFLGTRSRQTRCHVSGPELSPLFPNSFTESRNNLVWKESQQVTWPDPCLKHGYLQCEVTQLGPGKEIKCKGNKPLEKRLLGKDSSTWRTLFRDMLQVSPLD